VIALHALGGGTGGHDAALEALLYLPAAVLTFLIYVDVAAHLGVPGARAYLAAYARSDATVRLTSLLLAVSATVHLAVAPGHAADRITAALFLLDAAALAALAIGAFVLPQWRLLAGVLLVANLIAYAGYVLAGREVVDPVGIGTKLVELAAVALLASSAVDVKKEVSDPMNLSRTYAVVFGVVYTIVGLIGFAVSSTLMTANLVIFPVNLPHNLVHLLVGLLGIAAFFTARSVLYARGMAVLFAILTVAGFLPQPLLGLVPLGGADIALHALTAILAAVAGWAYATPEPAPTATT
jgi:hypothetical protein